VLTVVLPPDPVALLVAALDPPDPLESPPAPTLEDVAPLDPAFCPDGRVPSGSAEQAKTRAEMDHDHHAQTRERRIACLRQVGR
jgi:hypothetical protein